MRKGNIIDRFSTTLDQIDLNFSFYHQTFLFTIKCWIGTVFFGSLLLLFTLAFESFSNDSFMTFFEVLLLISLGAFCLGLPALLFSIVINQWLARYLHGRRFRLVLSILGIVLVLFSPMMMGDVGFDKELFRFIWPFVILGLIFTWLLKLEE